MPTDFIMDGSISEEFLQWRLEWYSKFILPHVDNNLIPVIRYSDQAGFECKALKSGKDRLIRISPDLTNVLTKYFMCVCGVHSSLGLTDFRNPPVLSLPVMNSVKLLRNELVNIRDPWPPPGDDMLDRWITGLGLSIAALDYLILHELGHHVLGHMELLNSEIVTTPADRQALEIHADLFAANLMKSVFDSDDDYQIFREFEHTSSFAVENFGVGNSKRYLVMIAISSAFLLFGNESWPTGAINDKNHPPDRFRRMAIVGKIAGHPNIAIDLVQAMVTASADEAAFYMSTFVPSFSMPTDPTTTDLEWLMNYRAELEDRFQIIFGAE